MKKWTPLEPFVGPLTEKRRDGNVLSYQLTNQQTHGPGDHGDTSAIQTDLRSWELHLH